MADERKSSVFKTVEPAEAPAQGQPDPVNTASSEFRDALYSEKETVVQLKLSELYPFPDHPFSVSDDEAMKNTTESIRQYGVLVPALVRPREAGGFEIISGHRRKRACELAGLSSMPVIVKDVDRDTAIIMMVDSNLQREQILPSERAKAYRMKLEAIKRQGARRNVTSPLVAAKFRSDDFIAEHEDISGDTVRRYIRLTELQPELLRMVDERKIGLTPAVELSYLKPEEQHALLETIESEQTTPSLSQAQRMKQLSREGQLTEDSILSILSEQKKPEAWNLTLSMNKLRQFFPRSYTPQRMEQTILKLLENWMRARQRSRDER